ncbi:hypothetical protein QBC37DRAFT_379359 [Rhypophila decipiens]|uniref:Uncharacterized protein n=1 Tax=Rhypophila decipiens TaxID=261697 RepID=A0AAN7B337_9PEZI|nr:hypothetical protein QBC37DRAFT_379359 [Rhypophila decipiens]
MAAAADDGQNTPLMPFGNHPEIALFFFCGNHLSLANGSGLLGPEGLIRSLVDQLLAQWPYDEPPQISDLSQRTRKFQAHNPDAFLDLGLDDLCFMFERILGQLGPEYPVCCIIDGVSHFETGLHGWRNDILYLVECFQGIISSRLDQDAINEVASVKVLLVGMDKSMVVRSVVPMDDHLELRAGRMATRSWLRSP